MKNYKLLKTFKSIAKEDYYIFFWAAVFLVLLFIYYLSMPKVVALEDDGLFILSAYYNGVSHPPGYPLHSLLSHFLTYLPFETVAVSVHMFSAFFGALTSVLIGIIIFHLYRNIILAISTSFIVGMGQGFWSQSVISEVYTLNAFFIFLLVFLVLKIKNISSSITDSEIKRKTLEKYLFFISLCIGLGLTNHWPLFILAGVGSGLALFQVVALKEVSWSRVGIGFLIGASPFLWLIINSNSEPFINFSGALGSLSETYDFVSRKYYRLGIDSSDSANFRDKVYLVLYSLKISLEEHSYLGVLFIILGVPYLFRKKYCFNILIVTFLSTSILLPILLDYNYSHWYKIIYKPYLLVSYAIAGILLSSGIYYVAQKTNHKNLVVSFLALAVIFSGLFINGGANLRGGYDYSIDYSATILDSLDENSILFVDGDVAAYTLAHARFILNHRPDIDVYHRKGLYFNTRLFDPRYISKSSRDEIIVEFVKSSSRTVYFTYPQGGVGLENHWLYYKFNKNKKDNKHVLFDFDENHRKFLLRVLTDKKDLDDEWTNNFNESLKFAALPTLFYQILKNKNSDVSIAYRDLIRSFFYNFTIYTYALQLIDRFKLYDFFGGESELIKTGETLFENEIDIKKRIQYLNTIAENAIMKGEHNKAYKYYSRSIKEWESDKNKAMNQLVFLCKKNVRHCN